jgi:hypothetical protein
MSDDEDISERVEDAIGRAIQDVIREHEGGFTMRWVAVIESCDESGERGAWTLASPDAKPWDTLGMLTYAQQLEQARVIAHRLDL